MKHLGYKKIGFMMSILLLGFFFSSSVYAQSGTTATTETLTDTVFNILGAGLNLLYLITLPVLVIAGKAMDNSMIYGEFINLDKPLYMLRNLSRTFANFAIGGVILRKVVQYIFNFSDNKSPAFLKSMMIKGVGIVLGINFSWFAIGALIDISTITTYSLGAMPLSILKETNSKDMPILSVGSYFDYQSSASRTEQGQETYTKPHTYYQRGNIYIPRCGEKGQTYKGFITGPEYFPNIPNRPDVKFNSFGNDENTQQYCALNTQTLANITALEKWKKENLQGGGLQAADNNDKNKFMKQVIDHITSTTGDCGTFSFSGSIELTGYQQARMEASIDSSKLNELKDLLKIGDSQISEKKICNSLTITGNAYKENNRQTAFMTGGQEPYTSQNGLTMNTLINKSKGMVGPFITLYMSLLDFSNLSVQDTENQNAATTLNGVTEFVLKGAISIALFIPLVALALTLIIRIVILRGIIAFIPLGIVLYGLKDDIKMPGGGMKIGGAEVNGGSILGLIFAPVLPVFAISISIIILQTLQLAMKPAIDNDNKTRDFLGIVITPDPNNQNTSCMNFWGLQTTCLDKGSEVSGGSGFANFLPWLFVNIFAIGLMWMMVKVAISGSKLTGKIGGDIMDLGSKALGSIPLISIGGKGIGATALSKTFDTGITAANNALTEEIFKQDREITNALGITPATPPSTTSGSSFSISKKAEVSKEFRNKLPTISEQNFEGYKKTIANTIASSTGGAEGVKESEKFIKAGSVAQAGVMTDFITDLVNEQNTLKQKLEKDTKNEEYKKQLQELESKIANLSKHTITGGYSDFIDKNTNTIEQSKINDFINYLNNSEVAKLLKDNGNIKNTYRDQIEKEFKQIEYKDGKFQATTTK